MADKQLNVIALISGGKDSLYSILHCIRNGHRVVALANLHPPQTNTRDASGRQDGEEEDMDSYMYQTIGHSVIPLYESALGIPLYRAPILGSAVETGREYGHSSERAGAPEGGEGDETESLVPLLRAVMKDHPSANAVSAGAILSTYQRTRIENVATRLGLVSLAWLWMYPILPPPAERLECPMEMGSPAGLLEDMASCGCDARIVKVASGGLDERVLWANVSEKRKMGGVRARVVAGMRRFVVGSGSGEGIGIRGAVLGEGGEYETLAVDGPGFLWKGRIEVEGWDAGVGEGGVAFVRVRGARCVGKSEEERGGYGVEDVRVPGGLDDGFAKVFDGLRLGEYGGKGEGDGPKDTDSQSPAWDIRATESAGRGVYVISNLTATEPGSSAEQQMGGITQKLRSSLQSIPGRTTDDVVFSTILLRRMSDFTSINAIYSKLFTKPNPPARVTVACGDTLPEGVDIMASFSIDMSPRESRRGLHVQSRSYWAPANIGPYSQAICVPLGEGNSIEAGGGLVHVAGQIPLEPASMEVGNGPKDRGLFGPFGFRSVLSLQHLWRIGRAMDVQWWVGAVAFLAGGENVQARARIASEVWSVMNTREPEQPEGLSEEEEDEDLIVDAWDIKYGGKEDPSKGESTYPGLPDFSVVDDDDKGLKPPFFAVQVDELPRGSDIEWQSQGVRGCKVELMEEHMAGISTAYTVVGQRERVVVAYIGIGIECSGSGLGKAIKESVERAVQIWPSSSTFHAVIYTPQPVVEGVGQGQIIPCRSVYYSTGEKLAAGVVLQIRLGNE
ncbi:hypothetical protein FQN54_001803 [Arachnomyces sp. PD_36]|nr:hypothetical protein FQN54_001803 [Arachnomyces sp. PD_36]